MSTHDDPKQHSRSLSPVLLGRSPAARQMRAAIDTAAGAPCVLIQSEPGLDPAAVARELHAHSGRRGAFVSLEFEAADTGVTEHILFGLVSVATPARDVETITAASALGRARGGTLFVGELSDLSASAQARLARVLRDGEVHLAGEDGRHRLGISIVAGTTIHDGEATDGGVRRELLRYLHRRRVTIPPLRQRPEDIAEIAQHLLQHLSTTGHEEARKARRAFTNGAQAVLAALPWYDNLDGLRAVLDRVVKKGTGETISLEDVLAGIRFDGALLPTAPTATLRTARKQFEREYIELVLQHHGGHIRDAAKTLGIERTNLYRKARQLGIPVTRLG